MRRRFRLNTKHETLNMKPIRKTQGEQETRNRKLATGEFFVRLKLNSFKFSSGQSLIEVLIAFTVSVVIGMALVSAGLATQRASISARNKSQATKLAQQYLEEIRLMRDTGGFPIPSHNANGSVQTYCWTIDTSSGTDPSAWQLIRVHTNPNVCNLWNNPGQVVGDEQVSLNNTVYYRRLVFTQITPNVSSKVTAKVMWAEGVNNRIVSAETTLTKWCEGAVTGVSGTCP